ncbi:hypothetical protein JEQ12_013389 [Ovis aries]|uniref:Uncharacterized protein n=1 Tax=Ovis aries TaxID=9940 RepID=A0A836AIF9_SHEEP|nr:hypothetical protein JEQ12_013389 [Ovis aries]
MGKARPRSLDAAGPGPGMVQGRSGSLTWWLCLMELSPNPQGPPAPEDEALCSLGGREHAQLPQGFRKLFQEHGLCEVLMGSPEVSGIQGRALSPGPALQAAAEEALDPQGWGSWDVSLPSGHSSFVCKFKQMKPESTSLF